MPIRTKRWNDGQEPEDGFRVLICRYRPRGLPKAEETWDDWQPQLGPSRELHAAYFGKGRLPASWGEYKTRYLREMLGQKKAIAALAARVRAGKTITLLCASRCVREERCHRSLLRELIEAEA